MNDNDFPPVSYDIVRFLHGHEINEETMMFSGQCCPLCELFRTTVVVNVDEECAA